MGAQKAFLSVVLRIAVSADEYTKGSVLFQPSFRKEAIPIESVQAKTEGLPLAVVAGALQLRAAPGEANVCRNPFTIGSTSLLTAWKVADGGRVDVISSRFREGSDQDAFAYAAIFPVREKRQKRPAMPPVPQLVAIFSWQICSILLDKALKIKCTF